MVSFLFIEWNQLFLAQGLCTCSPFCPRGSSCGGIFLCPTSGRKNVTFHDCSPQSALTSLNYYWSYHRTWCFGCLCRYLLLYIRSLFVYLSLLVCKLIQGRDPIIHTMSPCQVWTLAQGKHPINIYEEMNLAAWVFLPRLHQGVQNFTHFQLMIVKHIGFKDFSLFTKWEFLRLGLGIDT